MALDQDKLINMALNSEAGEWYRDDAIGDLVYFPDIKSVNALIKIINEELIDEYLRSVACETLAEILFKHEVMSLDVLKKNISKSQFEEVVYIINKFKVNK